MNPELPQVDMARYDNTETSTAGAPARSTDAMPFDFRRLDRISKLQLGAIHFLHESFVRNLTSSLSAYLRSYVSGSVVTVEQLHYTEFVAGLSSPTCLVALGMKPYEGTAVFEISPTVIFPILDVLLGGTGQTAATLNREITEIEQSLLEGLFRVLTRDLSEVWRPVAQIQFEVESVDTEPQLSKRLAPNEAVAAIRIELRIGDNAGMLNIAIPSITLKRMGRNFDRQWSVRKSESAESEGVLRRQLKRELALTFDARLNGPSILLRDLLALKPGDLLDLGEPLNARICGLVNGRNKFGGSVVLEGARRSFQVSALEE